MPFPSGATRIVRPGLLGATAASPFFGAGTGATATTAKGCDAARDAWLARYGRDFGKKECERGFKGKHGCDKNFPAWCATWGYGWKVPTPPPADGGGNIGQPSDSAALAGWKSVMSAALTFLHDFKSKIETAAYAPSTAIPGSALGLQAATNPDAQATSMFQDYTITLAEIDVARRTGQILWDARQLTTTPPTGPGGAADGTSGVGAGISPGGLVNVPGAGAGTEHPFTFEGGEAYGTDPVSYSAGTVYTPDQQMSMAPGTGGAPVPTAEEAPMGKPPMKPAVVIGILAAAGLGVWYLAKRRKGKGRVPSRPSLGASR